MAQGNCLPAALAAGILLATASWADTSLEPRPAEIMPQARNAILNDVIALPGRYLAVGDRGHILRSSDGSQWQQVATPVRAMLLRVRFIDDRHGWAVGHDGVVLATQDGGDSWRLIHYDAERGKPIYDVLFIDPDNGFIVGANAIFRRTRDGGQSWEDLEPDITIHGLHLSNILKLADGTLVVSGEKGTMARSPDGGDSWQQLRTPYAGSFFGMLPYRDSGVFVFGLRGNVYSAAHVAELPVQDADEWDEFSLETVTDPERLAEQGWRYYPNELKESLFGGSTLDADNVLLVGVNGAVVRSDGGRMRPIATPLEHTLGDALLTDRGLLTVGFSGVRLVSISQ